MEARRNQFSFSFSELRLEEIILLEFWF